MKSAPLVSAGPPGPASQEWRATTTGARVYLHAPIRRGYLGSVMARQARKVADDLGAGTVHVRAGWLGGPHYDLRAVAAAGRPIDWPDVAAALAEGARGMAVTMPSEAAYLRHAIELGRIESVPPPYPPLRPHGWVEILGPDDSPAGDDRLSALRASGLAFMLPPLLRTAATEGDGALLARVAEAFLALGDCHPFGLRFGTFSFRSHVEAFLHWAGPAADYRSAFAARLPGDGKVIEELACRAREGADGVAGGEWRSAFASCMACFTGQVTEDNLDKVAGPGAATRSPGPAVRRLRREEISSFHAAVAASGVIDDPPEWFAAYRLTINLFYQLLPALDVSPVQRFYLCYAIAEVVDRIYGETWQARLAALAAHQAATR